MKRGLALGMVPWLVLAVGCSDPPATTPDASGDGPADVTDVMSTPDAQPDAPPDARADALPEATVDTPPPTDTPAPTDVSVPLDAPADVVADRATSLDAPTDVALPSDAPPDVISGDLPDVPAADVTAADVVRTDTGTVCSTTREVDLLFVVDNSNSMAENQANLANNFTRLLDPLLNPPTDPATMRPAWQSARSLHVGVVSVDLGTPGSVVPSCANSDVGDDGLLNPVRNGLAIRSHQPWTTAPAGRRPARCTEDPNQFPSFLTFTAGSTVAADFAGDFVCNAYLSVAGCGLEQQLESAYRALVVHNPRDTPGNADPNAGFLRASSVLGIYFVTDEDDGSVRDCRFAETGRACIDALRVYDSLEEGWSSGDLNLRMYMYTPGSRQDPTWALERYLDPSDPARGFLGLRPGHPELVVIGALTGFPLRPPTTATGAIDWPAVLGRNPDGSDGLTAMSAEGPISMRQANMDPACSTRVVPACRREGSTAATVCDPGAQYYAWPSRRVAELVRRADALHGNGSIGSICANDHTTAMSDFARRVGRHLCP